MHRSGFVTIVGRPNVGKSTLLNNFIGEKVSIVSSKPQTTRNNIRAILNNDDYQIVFVDTPGIHKPRHELGEYMVNSANETMKDVDLILFLVTPCELISQGDMAILETLKSVKCTKFLVVNKVDDNTKTSVAKTLQLFSEQMVFDECIPISALHSRNVDKLLELMIDRMEEGPKFYSDDSYTDQSERFIVGEILREKALRNLSDEVPHGIAIEITSMKLINNVYQIEANIVCEKDSHKGIIIGKNGTMLKKIGTNARISMEKFLGTKVNLKTFVKIRKEWRDNPNFLNQFGYKKK